MKNPDTRKTKYMDKIQRFCLMNDTFMSVVFEDQKCAEELLSIILKKNLEIYDIKTQYNIQNLHGRSARLDIWAKDTNGKIYNVEVQNANEGAIPQRARYHSSLMDSSELMENEDWKKLPETYVIIITRSDVLGGNKPIYHIKRTIKEMNNKDFGDGTHIVYVNSKIQDETTSLGKLMHDFYCTNANDMYYKNLAARSGYLKNNEKEVFRMCEILDEVAAEAAAEASLEAAINTTIEICKDFGASTEDTVKKLVKKFHMPEDVALSRVKEHWGEEQK